ncbi:MAG TPA: hypothetical protein V6D43_02535 [Candidatus Sericytochromatia bacterium]|jgi:hypothetical protein
MFALQTNPASPAVLCVEIQQKNFFVVRDSRDAYSIAPSSFPGLPIFLPRCRFGKLWC